MVQKCSRREGDNVVKTCTRRKRDNVVENVQEKRIVYWRNVKEEKEII
jgi:hypothetical protein